MHAREGHPIIQKGMIKGMTAIRNRSRMVTVRIMRINYSKSLLTIIEKKPRKSEGLESPPLFLGLSTKVKCITLSFVLHY
jgi:hypothetical protein